MIEFEAVEKIDAHMHLNTDRRDLLHQAKDSRFRLVTINTEVPAFPSVKQQLQIAADQKKERLDFVVTFPTDNWGQPGWEDAAVEHIREGVENGAIGVKVWKNIGMTLRNGEDDFVMIDDPSFDAVFDFCEREGIPVLGHLGEPRNCWLPLEDMTVKSDREYFSRHPEYHMYRHPECPSYEQQLEARDRRLEKHRGLRFIGAHLGSLEWSVDKQAAWLDRFPNAAMDLAERINHLQYQAIEQRDKVQSFLIEYQDRILYGTDFIDDGEGSERQIRNQIRSLWEEHWTFFHSGKVITPTEGLPVRGLELPDGVMEKIFRDNALKWYPALES